MTEIKLHCSCGEVQGKIIALDSFSGTRIKCCCDDCQSFAKYLGDNHILDQYGGTEIFQIPISKLSITAGINAVSCIRLTSKGMYRWYASCCNTPIGNSMGAHMPFVGVIHNFIDKVSFSQAGVGECCGYIHAGFATKEVPVELLASKLKIMAKVLFKLLIWKVRGLERPSSLFDDSGNPIVKPKIL